MITLDGRHGEGGGQILRSSLALSLVTGQPFTLDHVRGGRRTPGLLRQHLTCVRAAQAVGDATVEGAQLRSQRLVFTPRGLTAGHHHFQVGSAGSTSLVLQSVLPALLRAEGTTTLRVEGGTHAMAAPPFPFLDEVYLPVLRRMGATVAAELVRPGFYPAGGGEVALTVTGGPIRPLRMLERGPIERVEVHAWAVGLTRRIATTEAEWIRQRLELPQDAVHARAPRGGRGPGNVVWIVAHTHCGDRPVRAVFTSFGRRGVRAQDVAEEAVQAFEAWRDSGAPVCGHLADQLLLPMALGGGGSFRTGPLTLHTRTNIDTLARFLPHVKVRVVEEGETVVVRVR